MIQSSPDLIAAWELIDGKDLPLVFIAGPYFGDGSPEVIEANIKEAESYAIALANLGVGFICPHLHTAHFGLKAQAGEPFYHRLDFQLLVRAADAILFTPRWQLSAGARREYAWSNWRLLPEFQPQSPQELDAIVDWACRFRPCHRLDFEDLLSELLCWSGDFEAFLLAHRSLSEDDIELLSRVRSVVNQHRRRWVWEVTRP